MHQRYARDGLVCISVSLDPLPKKKAALEFLQDHKATFANYLLDEEMDFWQNKWDVSGPPTVFVFDRQNQRVAKFDTTRDFTYADVEKVVQKLLPAK